MIPTTIPPDVHHYTSLYNWSRPGRFGSPFQSQLHLTEYVSDGRMYWIGTQVCLLGTAYDVKDDARRIVRRGLKDILDWLGEPLDVIPTHQEVLAALRAGDTEAFDNYRREQGLA